MNLELPNDIYISVLSEVDAILQSLQDLPSDKHVSQAKEKAVEIFGKLGAELKSNIESLSRNAEWEIYTIAFYGETNAGKSTIIETMRILLQEPEKMAEQQEFKTLEEKYGVSAERLAELRAAVEEAEKVCEKCQASLNQLEQGHQARTQDLRDKLSALQNAIRVRKEQASLWQKLMDLFVSPPEKKQNAALESDLHQLETERLQKHASLTQEQAAAQQAHEHRKEALQKAEADLSQLTNRADGAIIGNGRSDFTLETTSYKFAAGDEHFALLDVPGIEGKEAKVLHAIWEGVQKAHAVFYVTSKAAAPQKGDEMHQGTLEKIRQHLGAQTEVWTIYNKRVTNPMQLSQTDLTSEDEQASLLELDRRMEEVLADKYRGTVTLSAYPAFLAAASCLVPDSQNAVNKKKFMSKLSQPELLGKSGVSGFRELLVNDLVKDYEAKITRSNFNKANLVVRGTIEHIASTLKESFKPLAKELQKDADQAQLQLNTALDALKTRLESQGESAISEFTNTIRKKIYAEIDGDVSNDEFKEAFERLIKRQQAALVQKLPDIMQKEVEKFQTQIGDIVERFQVFAAELLDAYGDIRVSGLSGTFDLKIDIDNGINVTGLLGALVGGALMFWNPAGWVVLALGAVTVLVGAVKAVIGFFSSDYKKSQQRKSADSNLERITDKMRESLHESLASALPQLEPKVEALKAALDIPAAQITDIVTILAKSERQLKKLSHTIETAGAS
jgi:Asp-tRNA(Asn)/Glu-tRNA(Gln) amidotransferase C subunit